MDIAEDLALLAKHPDYRISRRLAIGDEHVFATNTSGEPCGRLAVIDTETTGLNVDLGDRIIDIAIATCADGVHLTSAPGSLTPAQVRALYAAAREPKELWMIPGASHGKCRELAGAEYDRRIMEFFIKTL